MTGAARTSAWLNPVTRKRLRRFWQLRRARWSLMALALLYIVTLCAEVVCNSRPLLLRTGGKLFFPFCRFYAEDEFLHNGRMTRPDYPALLKHEALADATVLWPLLRNDPYRIVPTAELDDELLVQVRITPLPQVCGILLDEKLVVRGAAGLESLLPDGSPLPELSGKPLSRFWKLPDDIGVRLAKRLSGAADEALLLDLAPQDGTSLPEAQLVFPPQRSSATPRRALRCRLLPSARTTDKHPIAKPVGWSFRKDKETPTRRMEAFASLPQELREEIAAARTALRSGEDVQSRQVTISGQRCTLAVELETARYPFRPTRGHWFGLDSAGRDVLARILYGLRLALNFGLILVALSLCGGSLAGILQGYLGGKTDLIGQRFTEIWSALPFLYVMILMGSIYGTGFCLLVVCYALFNWIGISYYMRAETLRLRRQPYVEAARCLGIGGWSIALRHILPNALVPLITFFPFSLVGAIGSLAALDYLGFGVPPPAPSLGELMAQAQPQPGAWWLIFFPSLALFCVMLAGVFIGEGIRNAFDPRRQARLQ